MAKRKRRNFTPEFKAEVVLEVTQRCDFPSRSVSAIIISTKINSHKWKQQLLENAETSLFASTDKHSSEAAQRIAHLEQLVGRLTLALDIQKKASTLLS